MSVVLQSHTQHALCCQCQWNPATLSIVSVKDPAFSWAASSSLWAFVEHTDKALVGSGPAPFSKFIIIMMRSPATRCHEFVRAGTAPHWPGLAWRASRTNAESVRQLLSGPRSPHVHPAPTYVRLTDSHHPAVGLRRRHERARCRRRRCALLPSPNNDVGVRGRARQNKHPKL
jgi:hypothetical protein